MENEKLQKAMFEMNVMENKLKQLDQQLSILEQHILQDEGIEANIEELSKSGKAEVVLPLGGGIFSQGSMDKIDKLLVSVGANVLVEKTVEEAKKSVSKRKEKMISAREDLANQVKTIVESMARIEKEIRSEAVAKE